MKKTDDTPLAFGKHMFKTPNEIADIDPNYITWLYEEFGDKYVSRSLYLACEMDEDGPDAGDEHY